MDHEGLNLVLILFVDLALYIPGLANKVLHRAKNAHSLRRSVSSLYYRALWLDDYLWLEEGQTG